MRFRFRRDPVAAREEGLFASKGWYVVGADYQEAGREVPLQRLNVPAWVGRGQSDILLAVHDALEHAVAGFDHPDECHREVAALGAMLFVRGEDLHRYVFARRRDLLRHQGPPLPLVGCTLEGLENAARDDSILEELAQEKGLSEGHLAAMKDKEGDDGAGLLSALREEPGPRWSSLSGEDEMHLEEAYTLLYPTAEERAGDDGLSELQSWAICYPKQAALVKDWLTWGYAAAKYLYGTEYVAGVIYRETGLLLSLVEETVQFMARDVPELVQQSLDLEVEVNWRRFRSHREGLLVEAYEDAREPTLRLCGMPYRLWEVTTNAIRQQVVVHPELQAAWILESGRGYFFNKPQ